VRVCGCGCVGVGVYLLYAAFTKECGKSVRPEIFACLSVFWL